MDNKQESNTYLLKEVTKIMPFDDENPMDSTIIVILQEEVIENHLSITVSSFIRITLEQGRGI